MPSEPTITFTKTEFLRLIEKIQDLATLGAFIYFPGMESGRVDVEETRIPSRLAGAPRGLVLDDAEILRRRDWKDEEIADIIQLYTNGESVDDIRLAHNAQAADIYALISKQRKLYGAHRVPYRKRRNDQTRLVHA